MSAAVWISRAAAAECRWRSGCSPVSAASPRRCALSVGHDGSLVRWGTTCGHTARQRSAAGKPHEVQVARAVALTKSGVEIDVVAVGVAHGRDPMSPWRVERLMGAA
jgi:hypothetical protein